ncbi:putative Ig domain-containing protein [Actinoplanes sp. TFC3]|uniref:putative Ig domain-containing protein n=1 Tax=Actinoplanes sp. TFC3 TaxID=1710355 RepID=UPI000831CA9B|nr:putative Ig domain-containing protein [Actinoplanes sp. TFC3]
MRRNPSNDDGFSLLEVIVAMAVIGTVMAGAVPFLARSLSVVNQQRAAQVAIQVANDALDRVRALDPTSLTSGRSATAVATQIARASSTVAAYLQTMAVASDPMLPNSSDAGASAPLPTEPVETTSNGVTFKQEWYVGKCYQSRVSSVVNGVLPIGNCVATQSPVYNLPFFKVVVAVSWPDKNCKDASCSYIASTTISTGTDAVFDVKTAAPTVIDPVAQRTYVGDVVALQVISTGGTLPLTWSVTGLPAGLTMSGTGLITGTPTTPGTFPVTVKVTDKEKRNDDSTFTWTVAASPVLTNPGKQVSRTNAAVNLQPVVTGGFAPMTWTSATLPAGLVLDKATGLITGTPTTAKTANVTLTVTDSGLVPRTSSVTFSWQVLTPVQLYDPGPQSMTNGTNVGTFTPYAFGGLAPYTWQVQNLPDGAVMDPSTGKVTGTIAHGTRYITTVTVTDAAGGTTTLSVVCNVVASSSSDLRVTAPLADQSTVSGKTVSLQATASGATASAYTWTATGLPTGLSMSSSGLITGTATTKGTYTVKLVVKSTGSTLANAMFVWTVS